MKILMTKEVLPASKPISHIRSFSDVCRYILFPFMKLYVPKDTHEDQSAESRVPTLSNSQKFNNLKQEVSSQISHNLSNGSQPNKSQIELQGRAVGIINGLIEMEFLSNRCLLSLHFIDACKFRVSITNIEKENNAMNMLAFDLITDRETYQTLFKEIHSSDFV